MNEDQVELVNAAIKAGIPPGLAAKAYLDAGRGYSRN